MSDGGNFDVTINGVLIDSHSCGTINPNQAEYGQLTGSYTPTVTGLYTLEIYNYRNDNMASLQNYFDDVKLTPVSSDFSSDTLQWSVSQAASAILSIDAGPSWAGWNYLVIFGGSGAWPGSWDNGVWIPVNMDSYVMYSYQHANSMMFVHTAGVLDQNGHAVAGINIPNALGQTWLGRSLNFSYVVFQGSWVKPVSRSSLPLTIYCIP